MRKNILLLVVISTICGSAGAQTVANGGMEDWISIPSSVSLERPEHWWGSDQVMYNMAGALDLAGYSMIPRKQLNKSDDRYEADSAARLMTRDYEGDVGLLPCLMANGEISVDLEAVLAAISLGEPITDFTSFLKISGGTPVSGRTVDSVTAYVWSPAANHDDAAMFVVAMKDTIIGGIDTQIEIGTGMQVISPDTGYQRIVVPVLYSDPANSATDTLRIIFASSYTTDTAISITNENRIFVDKVEVYAPEEPSGLSTEAAKASAFKIFPNPVDGQLWIQNQSKKQNCLLRIADITGKTLRDQSLNTGINEIDLYDLFPGLYLYYITDAKGKEQLRGKLVKL